ncbi:MULTISPECIES: N-acetyltransferase [unclassified Janthinobacterium]|uniref:GNAT family N-acetyltransferase n=1 Tax=unclassified Janthinobacterium TaxID=2610881 RepID=UPI0017EA3E95|nr:MULTISPECIES: GNAT family N-acetyltransferase [unclassified Janthinobacterium]MBB5609535.1 GNAT superfamily N-acetyltransferase [Janthinobacterium sp. S3T4]MBB5614618.1 GNAT superfamily N-acetyltransferase [Janthinobacterium sp. S3M3]
MVEMPIVIQDYMPSDREDLNQLALAAFAQYELHYEDWNGFQEGVARMSDLAGNADVIVAKRGGIVVGGIGHVGPGRPRDPIFPDQWSVIRMLVVAPEQRGQGIGKRLVAACLQRASRAGAAIVGLHTSPIMADALSLYTAIGFERDCDLPPINGVPYARYVLSAEAIPLALKLLNE